MHEKLATKQLSFIEGKYLHFTPSAPFATSQFRRQMHAGGSVYWAFSTARYGDGKGLKRNFKSRLFALNIKKINI